MTTTVTFDLTNSGLNNRIRKTFDADGSGNLYIDFDGSLIPKYKIFLVNLTLGQGAYIYSYNATNPSSDFITITQTAVISGSSPSGTYLTGLTPGQTYTASATILG
jgi:hypothetical protein